MKRLFHISILLSCINLCNAQQPIILDGQPDWKTGLNIENYTLVYEEVSDTALSLKTIQQRTFVPFHKNNYRYAKNPRIVQWLKFKITNTSKTDTIRLILNLNVHYSLQLYQQNTLLISKGISTEKNMADWAGLNFSIPPQTGYTYYARAEEHVRYLTPLFVHLETAGSYFEFFYSPHYRYHERPQQKLR